MQDLPRCTMHRKRKERQYVQCGYFADWFYRVGNSGGPREQIELGHSCRIPVRFPLCRIRGVGRTGRAHVNAHTNSSNTVARCSSALAFAARSVLQGENGTRSDVCRELFVQLGDAAVPFSPFPPPPPSPRARPALPRPRYRFSFSVFATAKCHCFWRRALGLRCSFNATRTAPVIGGSIGARSAGRVSRMERWYKYVDG